MDLSPRADFPLEVLPDEVQALAANLAAVLQTDPAVPATLALYTASVVLHPRARVHVFDQWYEHLPLWFLVRVPSGGTKSPSLRVFEGMLRPLEENERELRTWYTEELRKDAEAAKGQDDPHVTEAKLKAATPPENFRLFDDQPTPQAFGSEIARLNSSFNLLTEEGRAFLGILEGSYRTGSRDDPTPFLKAYDGGTIRGSRIMRDQTFCYDATGSFYVMTQEDAFDRFVQNEEFIASGLVGRFIPIHARDAVGERLPARERPQRDMGLIEQVSHRIRQIAAVPWASVNGHASFSSFYHRDAAPSIENPWPQGRMEDYRIDSGEGGREVFYDMDEALEPLFRDGELMGDARESGRKLVGLTARLAATIHAIENADRGAWLQIPIGDETALRAVEIARYVIGQAVAIASGVQRSADEAARYQKVIRWIQKQPQNKPFTWRQLRDGVKGGRLQDVDQIRALLMSALDDGAIQRDQAAQSRGARPVDRFRRAKDLRQDESTAWAFALDVTS